MTAPHSHIPFWKRGTGFYSEFTKGCYDVNLSAASLVNSVVEKVLCKFLVDETIVFADYGAGDGGTSMPLIYSCIKKVKETCGNNKNVHVMYEDQSTNDFLSLFLALDGLIPGCQSYAKDFSNVFYSATGCSFYSQCFPPQSVHFGFSSTSMHWLQQKPCNITNGLHHTQITLDNEKKKFKEQAAYDWQQLLVQRAKELKSGGFMVMVQLCIDENNYSLGKTTVKNSMFGVMDSISREMIQLGIISEEEYHNITFINYYRTIEEFRAPFDLQDSAVFKSGLKLISIKTVLVKCPFHKEWMEKPTIDKNAESARKHAEKFILTLRTWSNTTFLSALSKHRSEAERQDIVDRFFNIYVKRVSDDPDNHAMDYVHAHIVIEKI
ncbi:uncharacterized protein LOC100209108 isoform X1 [Hydra vulgaris]|uniref:uncharacterized protein LOC100209108 isoform X1 n=1 Tax=Hydra vulgaris TaxID=6087 RepID=UPI000640F847|nr:S-adenosyl-L-methionine:benzoic acid/salicylic acid carboxyl methyltransferase 3 [Hydra vulgaris]